jgi:hypothetical protein
MRVAIIVFRRGRLIQGAKSAVTTANKNARLLRAVLAKGRRFGPDHALVKREVPAVAVRPWRLERMPRRQRSSRRRALVDASHRSERRLVNSTTRVSRHEATTASEWSPD